MEQRRPVIPALVAATACLTLSLSARCSQGNAPEPFQRLELGEGVFLFQPASQDEGYTNSLVVVREDGLLVVDSQPSPQAAKHLLRGISRLSNKPVRYLVLSAPHAETSGGWSAFPDSAMVILSRGGREALLQDDYDYGADLRALAADPESWPSPSRPEAVLILWGPTTLDDAANPVDLMPMPHAHSRGDLMVDLTNRDLLYVGALAFQRKAPFAGDASVEGWVAVLNQVARHGRSTIAALHGPPLDLLGVRRDRDSLAWIRGQVAKAFIDLKNYRAIPEAVLGSAKLHEYFDRASRPVFLKSLVDATVAEAVDHRRKRNLPVE